PSSLPADPAYRGKPPGRLSQIRPQSVSVCDAWPAPAVAAALAAATSVARGADGAVVGDLGAAVPPPGPQPATRSTAIRRTPARRRRSGIAAIVPPSTARPPDVTGPRHSV